MLRPPEMPSAEIPRYLGILQQITDRIQAGEWNKGRLPAVRDLAEEYGVSGYTIQKAMQLLQQQGMIVSKDRSGCFVAPARQSVALAPLAGPWATVLRVSPGPSRAASEAVSRIGFDKVAAEDGVVFVPVRLELDPNDGNTDPDAAVRSARATGVKGVIFLPSRVSEAGRLQDEAFLAACQKAGLPVVLIDRSLRGPAGPLTHDLVTSDHFEGGRACAEHLIATGRRRIACVVASPTSSHADRLAGYLYALNAARLAGIDEFEPLVWQPPDDMNQTAVYGWLADRVRAAGSDGVVCYQDYTAVGLILELFQRGARVPGDVAVAGCDNLPIGNSFTLGVTTYAYPSAEIVRWAVRALANRLAHPADSPVKMVLPGKLIVRNSTVQRP